MAIAAGADVKVVQRMLGQADASMTLNTYAELLPDRLDEVSNAMSEQREEHSPNRRHDQARNRLLIETGNGPLTKHFGAPPRT